MVPAGPIELAAQKLLLGGGEEHVFMRFRHVRTAGEVQQVVLCPVIREGDTMRGPEVVPVVY